MTTPNLAESVNATIAVVDYHRTEIELDHHDWLAIALRVGDRCIVTTDSGDVCAGLVTGVRQISISASVGFEGNTVRVRRPQLARSS